jgi:hypothetical protein
MVHADKPHTSVAGDTYKARVGDIVSVEARITEIKGNRFVVEPLNGAEVYLSDVSRYTELRAPLNSKVIKRPLRVGDKVRYNMEPGVNEGYYHGRLVAYDNGHWIIRDNTSQRSGGSLVERTEADVYFDL